jgi:phage gpG-like protein
LGSVPLNFFSNARIKEDIRKTFKSSIKENFDTEGAASGAKWAPLAASTIRQRLAAGFSAGPILNRTGRLRRESLRAVDDFSISEQGSRITITFPTPYAIFQNNGTKNIPARPFLRFSPAQTEKLRKAVKKTFTEKLGKVR